MGLPSRSFAADAHHCIMVQVRTGPTEYKGVARMSAPDGELPSDDLGHRKACGYVDDRLRRPSPLPPLPEQARKAGKCSPSPTYPQAPQQTREIDINGNIRRGSAGGPKRSTSNHLTPKAPYKPAPAQAGERHRSREFIEFLKLLDRAYPADTAIEVILDNHSAHVSRETTSWLPAQPIGRFTFMFTPTHGSWLNLIEGFFSKLARSVLRHIRVASKHELRERLLAFISDINREPVVHTWHYKIDDAA